MIRFESGAAHPPLNVLLRDLVDQQPIKPPAGNDAAVWCAQAPADGRRVRLQGMLDNPASGYRLIERGL